MGLMGSDYRHQLQALLPHGAAWTRAEGSLWTQLLGAIAQEFARIDSRALTLIEEADPRSTSELLADWERVAGLPDNCSSLLAETLQGRRNDLVSKLVGTGGQSRAYFVDVARALGFEIAIEEFRPFQAGSLAGDAITNDGWRFTWRVRAPSVTVTSFRAGLSGAGEALSSWGNEVLECRIRHYQPAHTIVIFAYGPAGGGLLLLPDGAPILVPENIGIWLE